ncbi:MAG: hypothetical protein ACLPH3_05595 [Terracidiphilus sp.]
MFVYGVLAILCLIAGFGLGMYEYDLRRQIVEAIHQVRPDLEYRALFARARSLRSPELTAIYLEQFPQSRLLQWHKTVSIAAPACFLAFALFLALAIKHS